MRTKLLLADVLFWIHFLVGSLWLGLFLVPSSLWQNKVTFHFYLTIAVVGHQVLWGLLLMPWTKKFRMVCLLTTPMQVLRGEKISDPKNYDHSFFKELVGKNGIQIPHAISTLITFSALALVIYQFFFLR
ncbi:MAG: hypothetical protein HY425_01555 [Candidatus Levybacteria bacterium]|nr:hypothetical protein [Candidatus Levybacteria bacterium]